MSLGVQSAVLLIAIVQGLVFAVLLVRCPRNRTANRYLALLLVLVAIALVPSTIGFAGAYAKYERLRWFLPTSVTFGFGPAIFLYTRRLLRGPHTHWKWPALHLLPLIVQVSYYVVLFVLPIPMKTWFGRNVHGPYLGEAERVLGIASGVAYWIASYRLARQYSAWAPTRVSDSENYSLDWLRVFLSLTAIGFAVWAGFVAWDLLASRLTYGDFFWLDLTVAVLAYGFAIAGYRRADLAWPAMDEPSPSPEAPPTRSTPDWVAQAAEIEARLREQQWYLDPDLTLDSLARKLGTNTWAVSRAINEGAGVNFNDFVNGFRVEAVQWKLADPSETATLLDLALSCGFNSKTSFNRSFRKLAGVTPSAYRRGEREPADGPAEAVIASAKS
ncbi:MAG: AraC family transcriptional regulator [Planctomycetota bacterium]